MDTPICVVERLSKTKESKGPIELLSVTVVTSRVVLANSGRMLAQMRSNLSTGAACQAKGGLVEEVLLSSESTFCNDGCLS